jgi:threonine dehydrogenase-like Zn-dependent dehydrogenase
VTLVEPNAIRRSFLQERCGQTVVSPDELDKGELFDLVLDGVGYAQTRAMASRHVRPGGTIVHIGLAEDIGGLDVRRMTLQEITFIGTYTYTSEDFHQTARAIFDGQLGPLDWIATRPLGEGAQAFRDIRSGLSAEPKIVLMPDL